MSEFNISIDKKTAITWIGILGFGGTSVFNTVTGKETHKTEHQIEQRLRQAEATITELNNKVNRYGSQIQHNTNENQNQSRELQWLKDDIYGY